MKIRINLTEAKALEDPKKAAADKKAADKKAAEKKAAAKKAAEKKAEEKEKDAKKKAKLKESIRPIVVKMIKENNGFGATVEEDLNEDTLQEVDMQVINDLMANFSDIAEHGSMQTKILGQVLQALGAAGMTIPAIKAVVDVAKRKLPRAFNAAEQGQEGGKEQGAEPEL